MAIRSALSFLLVTALTGQAQEIAVACRTANRVKVNVPGRLKVVSANRPDVAYSVARSAPGLQVKAQEQNGWCVIHVSGGDGLASTEIQITLPRRITLSRLESRGGSISARYLSGEVIATTNAGAIEMDDIGGDVNARTGGGPMSFGVVRGSLRCLSGGGSIKAGKIGREAVLESAGGEIFVDEAWGRLSISTAGNIRVGRAAQSVFAYTSTGLVEVDEAGGMVTAETGGGSIQIGSAKGARCDVASGSIRIKDVSGSVRASTASGSIFVALSAERPIESSFLGSGRGDVTVWLPSNLSVTVKALNETAGSSGKVTSEFPEIRRLPVEAGQGRPVVAQGSLNGGGPVLMLSSTNGAISIQRRH